MSCLEFIAPEYQQDTGFIFTPYSFDGDEVNGWTITRNGQIALELGPGYVPVKTQFCGICSTDLMRHHLPFPLPQITGHEVIGLYEDQAVAVEINASHFARAVPYHDCPYCANGLHIHCPERLTLGIDRLPGGFAPWLLAPRQALHVLPALVTPRMAVLIEPFAAALKAVQLSPPANGDSVAVIGPRRLGMLLLAALAGYREMSGKSFTLTAVLRHEQLGAVAKTLGADHVLLVNQNKPQAEALFDVVFDTTGSQGGFELAVGLTRRILHLKSTHGQAMQGLHHLTDMVINEQSIQAYSEENIIRALNGLNVDRKKINIYVAPTVSEDVCRQIEQMGEHIVVHQILAADALQACIEKSNTFNDATLPRYDLVIVSTFSEVDTVLCGQTQSPASLLRPQGRIFLLAHETKPDKSALYKAISQRGTCLETSRCGDFGEALAMLSSLPRLAKKLEGLLITQEFDLNNIEQAFQYARESKKSIKVIIKTN